MQIFQRESFPNKTEHPVSAGVRKNKYLKDTAAELTKDEPKVSSAVLSNWTLDYLVLQKKIKSTLILYFILTFP